jgi:dienelactone hydrolase
MALLTLPPLHLFFSLFLVTSAYAQFLIPAPTGEYTTGHSTLKLVDTARIDPYNATYGPRALMISLFYPITKSSCKKICQTPYMPPITAAYIDAYVAGLGIPNGTFESIHLQMCCSTPAAAAKDVTNFPLVLFSPGLQGIRLQYSALAQQLASAGYAVATMDHTFESQIVEFPDGTFVQTLNDSYFDPRVPGLLDSVFRIREADAQFVLAQLGRKDVVSKLVPGAKCGFSIDAQKGGKVGFYGHSFGGALAVATLLSPASPIAAAINLDGSQFGNLVDTKKPALLFGRAEPSPHNRTLDATWAAAWTHMKGWRREIAATDIEHGTFADTGVLLKLMAEAGLELGDVVKDMIGALDGARSFEIITAVVRTFFDLTLKGKKTTLFEKGDRAYPELVVG